MSKHVLAFTFICIALLSVGCSQTDSQYGQETAISSLSGNIVSTVSKSIPAVEEGVKIINGVQIYYKIVGTGEPILMLHGGPGFDHHHMTHMNRLAGQYQLIYFDQRGAGNSIAAINSKSINLDNFMADIEAMRKSFKLDKMNLLGTSFGGLLAMQYGIRYPQNLKRLILVATVPASLKNFSNVGGNIEERTSSEDKRLMDSISATEDYKNKEKRSHQDFYRIFFRAYLYDKSLSDEIDLTFGENTVANMDNINELMYQSLGDFDIHNELYRIQCPVLVLHGDTDPFPYDAVDQIHQALPNSQYILMENTGHFLDIERPERFFAEIEGFMKES